MQVALFDDWLEITSPGMLIGGLSIEDLKNGCSKTKKSCSSDRLYLYEDY
jgi:predicted HTH transcriptional regulator